MRHHCKGCLDTVQTQDHPLHAEAHYRLGYSYLTDGRLREAVDSFRRAVLLESDYVDALLGLAYAWVQLEEWEEAEAALGFALQYEPDDAETQCLLGWVLEQQGRLDEAAAYREAVRLAPAYAAAWERLIEALVTAGEYEEASAAAVDAPELDPKVLPHPVSCVGESGSLSADS